MADPCLSESRSDCNSECWRAIEGFDDYSVSSLGRVRRSKPCPSSQGRSWVGRILKPKDDKYGYPTVKLCAGGAIKTLKVHRLVALAFLPSEPGKDQVNHKDGVKHNNCVENLEWCDISWNTRHAFAMGLNKPNGKPQVGDKNGAATLKNGEVWLMKKLIYHGVKTGVLTKMFKTNRYVIYDIRHGRHWNNVVFDPNERAVEYAPAIKARDPDRLEAV